MQPLSALGAIGPAWTHTRQLLFAPPRRWRTILKLTVVAFFAQFGCSSSLRLPSSNLGHNGAHLPPAFLAAMAAFMGLFFAVGLLLALLFFYLSSRLQFVLFDSVLRLDTTLTPIWRRYGAATWRWIGLKLAFFAAAVVCFSPVLIPFVLFLVRASSRGAHPLHFATLFASIAGITLLFLGCLMIVCCAFLLLSDFGLPSMALEGTSIGETVRRVFALLRVEPGPVLLFVLMRVLLAFGISLGLELGIALAAVILAIPLGALGFGLWAALHHAGAAGQIILYAGIGLLVAVLAAVVILAAFILFGTMFIFLQAYALFFLGGRYPLLGQYLAPYLPPPTPTYPPPYGTGGFQPPPQPTAL